ncbi:uncharacterized protein [Musca autumnalis]|uniref:uncharacterized protein n=1 Tax=Musca autumnalis TaxID=221902 RepID=UPI003CF31F42
MAFKSLAQICRVGHLLAQPTKMALVNSPKPSTPIMAQCRHCQLVYQAREDCEKKPEVKCGTHFKNEPCAPLSKKSKKKSNTKQKTTTIPTPVTGNESEIQLKIPDICDSNPCKDAVTRFDLLFYKRSDKSNREYQQTWAECPQLVIKPKVVCSYENIVYPQMKKRPRQERPTTACKPPTCGANTKSTCPSFQLPNCRSARKPPKCHVNREPKNCTKLNAPYPAFSECRRDIPKPLHPVECKCLALPTMCEVWAHYNRMRAINSGKSG